MNSLFRSLGLSGLAGYGSCFSLFFLGSGSRLLLGNIENPYVPIGYSHKLSDDRLKFYEHTFQFDWTRPFAGGHKLETGAKYILRINNSKTYQTYDQIALNDTTDFHHTTHVGALYSEYSYNSTRWGARAGLRYELARMGASYPDGSQPSFHSTLHDVVPTLSVSYKFNDANTLKLNYASRISRPGISYLNPAVIGDTYNVRQGNPNLKSARSHSINLDYTLMIPKLVLNVSLMHRFSNGLIQSVVTTKDNVVYYTYDNVGKYRNTWTHQIPLAVLANDPDVCNDVIDGLANGQFVVILRNKQKANKGEYQVYGYAQGLTASEGTNEKYSEDTDGGWLITLQEVSTPKCALFYYNTDDKTTATQFASLTTAASSV